VKKIIIAVASAVALAFVGCASAPAPTSTSAPVKMPVAYPPQILEHQNTAFGGDVPVWVTTEAQDLQSQDKYKDVYVFKFEGAGQDLDGTKIATDKLDAVATIASQISTRVQAKFAGAQVGDKNKVETYFENIVKTLTDTKFSGLKKEGSFWVHLQLFTPEGKPDKQEFRVRVLYTIPKKTLDDQVKAAIDGLDSTGDKPKTEDEKTARDEVKKALTDGGL